MELFKERLIEIYHHVLITLIILIVVGIPAALFICFVKWIGEPVAEFILGAIIVIASMYYVCKFIYWLLIEPFTKKGDAA
ncbi:hypothetical protein GH892_02220 [Bacillus thuringiensis]|uniref:hypothetical protein n=1 Tax=Bacillus toyonensis TaxID=155322 RepID=UPI001298D461|nr:hypothetical protein [Bacillus thuringiensis]